LHLTGLEPPEIQECAIMTNPFPSGFLRIVVPHDFSAPSCRLLEQTLELAAISDAQLEVLHAVHYPTLVEIEMTGEEPAVESFDQLLRTQTQSAVDNVRNRLSGGPEIPFPEIVLRRGAVAKTIVERAAETGADLIVMATHGRRGFTRLLIGSVTDEVIRRAPCPVLVVRRPEAWQGLHAVRHVVVPHDTSEHSQAALRLASGIAKACGAALDLVHVIPEPIHPSYYAAAAASHFTARHEELQDATRRELERLLLSLATEHTPSGEVTLHTPVGDPAQEIVALAERLDAGLITIATHGLTGIDRLLIGSVSERVIRRADCAVLVVPPFGSLAE
jgi:nucleotide-binding universal stress UspA family protein